MPKLENYIIQQASGSIAELYKSGEAFCRCMRACKPQKFWVSLQVKALNDFLSEYRSRVHYFGFLYNGICYSCTEVVQQHMHACTLCTAAVIISSYVGHFFVWRIKCKICVAVLITSPWWLQRYMWFPVKSGALVVDHSCLKWGNEFYLWSKWPGPQGTWNQHEWHQFCIHARPPRDYMCMSRVVCGLCKIACMCMSYSLKPIYMLELWKSPFHVCMYVGSSESSKMVKLRVHSVGSRRARFPCMLVVFTAISLIVSWSMWSSECEQRNALL